MDKTNPKNHCMRFEPHADPKPALICTCGWIYNKARRAKVFQTAATKHAKKTGHGFRRNSATG